MTVTTEIPQPYVVCSLRSWLPLRSFATAEEGAEWARANEPYPGAWIEVLDTDARIRWSFGKTRARGEGYRYIGDDPRLAGSVASAIDDCDCEIDEQLDIWDPARRAKVLLTDGRRFDCVPFAHFTKGH